MNYTLHQLEIFNKISELQSVTKAAEALYLTQPAVSIQLKKFQEQFNVPLFEVVGRKIFITDFGKEIAETAQTILKEVESINYKSLMHQGKLAGKLKIAIVSTAKYAMPYFLADFINDNDGIDLSIDVTNKSSVIQSVEENEVDFAMVSTIPKNMDINRIELMKNKLHLVASSQLINKKGKISKNELERLPLIFREKGSATRLAMENFISSQNITAFKTIELKSNEAVKQAVIAGLGVSVMPIIGIKNALNKGELHILNVKGLPMQTTWHLIWLKSKKLSPVSQALVKHIESHKSRIIEKYFSWLKEY